ncbi:MAG: flagellar hook-basal body complex protein FliE [Deltaproteobacteria bacterium]|nr:flagellar hook-basal body complex protein FliE [Deltaproteobacteria bacterium]MBI2533908.1 flagellar hook-basal body complex protein FliE [Deltaproteobacteria bacterium]
MSVIRGIDLILPKATPASPAGPAGAQKGDFSTHLKNALGEVNELQQKAEQAIQQLAGEGKGDLQETMIAIEKADVSFRLMMQIRNKVLEAYQEIMRMQV